MKQILKLILLSLLLSGAVQAADVDALVKQADSSEFAQREAANAELRRLPAESLPAMKAALDSGKLSPEAAGRV
jgi:hypothetical protein